MNGPDAGVIRVLVIENDPGDVELNLAGLRRAGLNPEADVVSTPAHLDAALAERTYDVVLSDFRMPTWTGMDALATVRARCGDLPFILVTGTLGEERAVESLRQGATDYILKSNIRRLPAAVTRAIQEHRERSERRRAEARAADAQRQVRETAERFAQLADNIREVFFLVDAAFRETLYINAAYEAVWGRPRTELYADPRSFLEGVARDDRRQLLADIAAMQSGVDPGTRRFRVIRPDGTVRSVLNHAVPVRDEAGRVYRIAGFVLDVTAETETAHALRRSEERFRALADASFDGIAVTRDGVVTEVNKGLVAMFGYPEAELVGRRAVEFLAPEVHAATADRIAQRVEGRYDLVGIRKDGARLLLEATAREQGADRITALRDVTEQRALEAKFRQAQKMEAVGRLAGAVAHDFNNLLTVIGSYAGFLAEELPAGDARHEYVEEIAHAATSAADLTRRLLAFSRQQVVQPRVVALDQVIDRTRGMLQRLIGEDVRLVSEPGGENVRVSADPMQLEQVIMNLAVNARDAMPSGGTLTIGASVADAGTAAVRASAGPGAGPFAVLTVRDTGEGMDDATASQIFEPFFTTKEAGKGTGLGLSTVYAIVDQAGGFIDVDTVRGHGTTFRIFLPLVEGHSDDDGAPSGPRASGDETVLLVEDSAPVRAAVRGMLDRLGYTVLEAPDGRTALHFVGQRRPIHLLVTDVIMPEMSGREVAEEAQRIRPDLKVLYMSGYTDDSAVRAGIEAAAFLQKPFTADALGFKVRATLDA